MARLRRATLRDLALLVEHRRRMFEDMGEYSPRQLAASNAVFRRWARQRLRSGKLVGWIVEERGSPVSSGCVWLQEVQPRPGWPGPVQPYLMSMFTEPAARGKGHAGRIVREAIRWCEARGYPRFTLHASKRGRSVYAKVGFWRTWEMRLDLPVSRKPSATRGSDGGSPSRWGGRRASWRSRR